MISRLKSWGPLVALGFLWELLNHYLFLPLVWQITTPLLKAASIPFVSIANTTWLITHRLIIVILLIIELLAVLGLFTSELISIVIAAKAITDGSFTWKTSLRQWLKHDRLLGGPLVLETGILILALAPWVSLIFKTPLFVELRLPEILLDFLFRKPIFLILGFITNLVCLSLTIRCLPTIWYQINQRMAFKTAWQYSRTKAPVVWQATWRIGILASGFSVLITLIGLAIQASWHPTPSLTLALIQWGHLIILMLSGGWFVDQVLQTQRPRWQKGWVLGGGLSLLFLGLAFTEAQWYFQPLRRPMVISHRGTNANNAVQNTLTALKETRHDHPTAIEMDIHETRDHQFIVVHDENLKHLTGINKRPHQLTLRELTKLQVHEHGHSGKLVSFSHYLKVADQLHVPLIVEIKTTPADSTTMVNHFNRLYGQTLIRHHAYVHSLDYRVIQKLHQLNPQLKPLYLQPYTITSPLLGIGEDMEYSTLNPHFIRQTHQLKQLVFAWTVDTKWGIREMYFYHVDGIITNNLSEAKQTLAKLQNHPSITKRMLVYLFF